MPKHSYICLSDFKNLSLQILGKEMKRYSLNWINKDINITIIKYAISIIYFSFTLIFFCVQPVYMIISAVISYSKHIIE